MSRPISRRSSIRGGGRGPRGRAGELYADCADIPALAEQAWSAIEAANDPPELFLHGGTSVVRIVGLQGDETIERLSEAAFRHYRGLVYESPGFVEFFRALTPIREIAELNIGSRPSSRKASQRIEDLRAIPWVFSWAQCRLMLPGWYGFGSAVDAWIKQHPDKGIAFLQELYREWPFFQTLLSNMDMVLSKSSIAIASRYVELVEDKKTGILFQAGSRQALVQAILELLDNRDRWPELRANGRRFVESIRNWKNSVANYREPYLRLVEKH